MAFDLKVGPFEPEFAGKMDFYLNLLNDKNAPRRPASIGIILCAEKDDVEVEYALRTKTNPIGVAAYQLHPKLPGELKGKLPTARQLSAVVRAELEERDDGPARQALRYDAQWLAARAGASRRGAKQCLTICDVRIVIR